jgi:hypothetical protein
MSAFTADEVEFVRLRGNLWAAKVWLGLHDNNRAGLYGAKDDESIRAFIIEKYEKKRWERTNGFDGKDALGPV